MKSLLLLFCAIIFAHPVASQQTELNQILAALQNFNTDPQAQETVAQYSFNRIQAFDQGNFTFVSGQTFSTDIPTIDGYTAQVSANVNNNGNPNVVPMLAIMYKDQTDNTWKIFDLIPSVLPNNKYNTIKNQIDNGVFPSSEEDSYGELAYWCMMTGKLTEADTAIKTAFTKAKANNNTNFSSFVYLILSAINL